MINLKPLTTLESIKHYMTKEDVFKDIYGQDEWDINLVNLNSICFIGTLDGKDAGVIQLILEGTTHAEWHGALYKEFRGRGKEILTDVLTQLSKLMPDRVFWTRFKRKNKGARKLAESMGNEFFGKLSHKDRDESLYFYRWN